MQLDRTRIAITERGSLELLDFSLHVLRTYFFPFMGMFALGVVPMMIVNHLLVGWMISESFVDFFDEYAGWNVARFIWWMLILVAVEAPLASVFSTLYLGQAVFFDERTTWEIVRDVFRRWWALIWCHIVLRGVGVTWIILAMSRGESEMTPLEALLIPTVLIVLMVRGFRPFINEILLLERNRLQAKSKQVMTASRRSSLLHGPSSGDLFSRMIVYGLLALLLILSTFGSCCFLLGVFFGQWVPTPSMILYALPACMWLVAGYLSVVRFMSYIDTRIRHEGWEVELRLRAEAARLTSRIT